MQHCTIPGFPDGSEPQCVQPACCSPALGKSVVGGPLLLCSQSQLNDRRGHAAETLGADKCHSGRAVAK